MGPDVIQIIAADYLSSIHRLNKLMYYINKCNMKRFMKFYNTCTYTWLNIDPFSIPRRSRGRGGGLHVSYNLGVCVWEIKVSAWSMQVRYMVLSSPNLIGCMVHLGWWWISQTWMNTVCGAPQSLWSRSYTEA